MAGLEDLIAEDRGGGYGLARYLAAKRATQEQGLQDQQIQQQQEFLQKRQALGPNASPQDVINLGMQYLGPKEAVHEMQTSLDRREAIAGRLQQSHELAQYRIDNLQRQKEADLARVKSDEGKQAIDEWYKGETLRLREHQNSVEEELKRLGLSIQQQRADQVGATQKEKRDQPLIDMLDKIDATKRMIQNNPEAVGGMGMLNRGKEFVSGMINPGEETPASNLQTQILDLQRHYRGLPGHAASRLKIDAAKIDELIKGLGTFTNADQAVGSLDTLRGTISKQLGQESPEAAPENPQFPSAPMNPSDRVDGAPYTTPKGVLRWNKKKGKWLAP